MKDPKCISVVIRTFNSARTLDSVLKVLNLKNADEVIIVDSGSLDLTLSIARKYNSTIVSPKGPFNYSKSLNHGFKSARNPWILVLSSHSIPLIPDILGTYKSELEKFEENVVVGYGPNGLSSESDSTFASTDTVFFDNTAYSRMASFCGNGNAIYRRSAWEQLPFDETVRTEEDKLWLRQACAKGWKFAYMPSVRTINKNQASLYYMYRKGYSDARAFPRDSDHPKMRFHHLLGALKNILKSRLMGKIDQGNWARYSAHILGQYLGSFGEQNNLPQWK